MFDDKPVHHAMERIFAPMGQAPVAPPPATRSRSLATAASGRRRWFMGKDGIAAAGFALAITAVGVAMTPLLTKPTPPPVRAIATPPPAITAPAPVAAPAPAPAASMPAPIVPPSVAAPAPAPVAAPARLHRAKPVRRLVRARPRRAAHAYRRRASPRLAGAALRRALARDVILTRRLNQEALRRLPPARR